MSDIPIATRARIVATGSYLPERVLTNTELEQMVDTSDEWIQARTGIRERHIAAEGQATSHMAAAAGRRALASARLEASELDALIVGTITPDMIFPSTACFVQEQIGANRAFCLDVGAACSGFLFGLETARGMLSSGTARTAMVIGAEKLSSITDWEDRTTCVLFGDGAGAAVLQPSADGHGIMASVMGSDGGLAELLHVPGGGSRRPTTRETVSQRLHYMKMAGREVFKHAVRCMCDAGQKALLKSGLTIDDVDCVIPHQANMRIIKVVADRLGTTLDHFYVNLDRVGNMSGASVPVALDEAVRAGRVKQGDIVLFVVFGGGFTWGASVMKW